MTRSERLALEEMSLQAYGSRTRYKKMMENGIVSDLKDETGRSYRGLQRFDLDEIKAVMEEEIEEKKKKVEEKLARATEQSKSETTNS